MLNKSPRQLIADQIILQMAASIALHVGHGESWSVVDTLIEDLPAKIPKIFMESAIGTMAALADVYTREELRQMSRGFHQESELSRL